MGRRCVLNVLLSTSKRWLWLSQDAMCSILFIWKKLLEYIFMRKDPRQKQTSLLSTRNSASSDVSLHIVFIHVYSRYLMAMHWFQMYLVSVKSQHTLPALRRLFYQIKQQFDTDWSNLLNYQITFSSVLISLGQISGKSLTKPEWLEWDISL